MIETKQPECPHCGLEVFFDGTSCQHCGYGLKPGEAPTGESVRASALHPVGFPASPSRIRIENPPERELGPSAGSTLFVLAIVALILGVGLRLAAPNASSPKRQNSEVKPRIRWDDLNSETASTMNTLGDWKEWTEFEKQLFCDQWTRNKTIPSQELEAIIESRTRDSLTSDSRSLDEISAEISSIFDLSHGREGDLEVHEFQKDWTAEILDFVNQ